MTGDGLDGMEGYPQAPTLFDTSGTQPEGASHPRGTSPANGWVVAAFEQWWKTYPRRVAKGAARKAYAGALRKTHPRTLQEAVERYAADPNLPEAQYVPHPATWLNQERWSDGPLPPRRGQDGTFAALRRAAERGRQ